MLKSIIKNKKIVINIIFHLFALLKLIHYLRKTINMISFFLNKRPVKFQYFAVIAKTNSTQQQLIHVLFLVF